MGIQKKLLQQYNIVDHDDKHKDLIYRETDNDKLLNLVQPNDIILDGGAHIGAFCLAASSLANKIYAYEPEENNFNLLQQNVNANDIENVKVFKEGFTADEDGEATIWLDPVRSMNATVFKKRTTSIAKTIRLTNFENILLRHPDCTLLKMDIEGPEYPIFVKYFDLIQQQFRAIAVEFHLDNVGEVKGHKSKREDVDKWYQFNEILKTKYDIIQQRNKKAISYVDEKKGEVTYLRNGIDFITAIRR